MPAENTKTSTTARKANLDGPHATTAEARRASKAPTDVTPEQSYASAAGRGLRRSQRGSRASMPMDTAADNAVKEDQTADTKDSKGTPDIASKNPFDVLDDDETMSPLSDEEDGDATPTPNDAPAKEEAPTPSAATPAPEQTAPEPTQAAQQEPTVAKEEPSPLDTQHAKDDVPSTPLPKTKGKGKGKARASHPKTPPPPSPSTIPDSSPVHGSSGTTDSQRAGSRTAAGGAYPGDWAEGAFEFIHDLQGEYASTYAAQPAPTPAFLFATSVGMTPDGKVRPTASMEEVEDEDAEPVRKRRREASGSFVRSSPPLPTPTRFRARTPPRNVPRTQKKAYTPNPAPDDGNNPAPAPATATAAPPANRSTASRLRQALVRPAAVAGSSTAHASNGLTIADFPVVHYTHSGNLLQYVAMHQVDRWDEEETPHLLLDIFDQQAKNPDAHATVGAVICSKITEWTGEEDPHVAPPIQSDEGAAANIFPSVFFVSNISARSRDFLLRQRILDCDKFSAHAVPHRLISPAYLFPLGGFTTTSVTKVAAIVADKWISQESCDGLGKIIQDNANKPVPLTDEHVRRFIQSLHVKRVDTKGPGGILIPRFIILIDPNTIPDDDFWYILRDHFLSLTYQSPMEGTGTLQQPLYCHICHGCDHPRGLCPFPNVPGWKGPEHDTPNRGNNSNNSNGRARGRGEDNFAPRGGFFGARRGRRF
ncbi:hypothetical protein FA95DRAFT_1600844 [Auriscalpium vulgare]|uniref:Uncharacterized protein n=1 Tax=Auriscalpium vulgare TaxID=40419 RepID=A0ACB8SAU2_9AGAM|nr:hypothetical protein FA95DRAFT_1600844 [Auriscalpium vulgare]